MEEINKNEFKDLKYILTSSMRTKLLISVYEKPKNLEDLRNELKKPSATILHGLKELENLKYVKKKNKYYSLTSNGYLLVVNILKLIENWYAINKNKSFWNNHYLEDIPSEILKEIYLLKNAKCINSTNNNLSKPITSYLDIVKDSKMMKIVLPIFSKVLLENMAKMIETGYLESLEIITNEEILESMQNDEYINDIILNSKNTKIKSTEMNKNLFLTCTESVMTINLFFKDGHYDDSEILIDMTPEGIKWGTQLYNHFNRLENSIKKEGKI